MKIKFGALMTDGAGKIGGQVVQHTQSGVMLRSQSKVIRRSTTSQVSQRQAFEQVVKYWQSLSEINRQVWSAANLKYQNGFQYFTSFNILRVKAGLPIADTPATGLTITDDFESYSLGNLGGQGNWYANNRNVTVANFSGNKGIIPQASQASFVSRTEAFSGNHSSQIEIIGSVSNRYLGVCVRASGNGAGRKAYFYYTGEIGRFLAYYSSSFVYIASAGDITPVNSTLKLSINGNQISCYINGSLDTSLNAGTGIFTDNTIPSGGTPGIYAFGTTGSLAYGDNFVGQDV